MYLKQLDIVGFKSFADKTRLAFEPGMIAIVGPNGCGKSNVSDAIRWVLGEQRPTALRCSKMSDVLFNGTDSRKPLGMAEVSITFADCEGALGTEYHEVTVTRRVYRSGEGEYFINKTPSRLKDVQRLFMGTGIGTTSYSVMAQGQIDQILSSRPEDRRAVFEEAAGITKFKADRKEALRKISQTEQNLLREADVLREMKRQIGSLQRQVGKAQRYKELREELRGLDIYVSKGKIQALELALENNLKSQKMTEEAIAAAITAVTEAEGAASAAHEAMHRLEETLGNLATEAAAADGAYQRAREVIAVNEQRIAEYRSFSERDGREIAETKRLLDDVRMQLESLDQKTLLLEDAGRKAVDELDAAEKAFAELSARTDALREELQKLRNDAWAADRTANETRAEMTRLEEAAREKILMRERLTAEVAQLEEDARVAIAARNEVQERLAAQQVAEQAAEQAAEAAEAAQRALQVELEDLRANFGKMQAEAAAKEAQLAMLQGDVAAEASFAGGAQVLLEGMSELPEGTIVGSLADRFDAPSEWRLALEAVLRRWLDAVVAKDASSAVLAAEALLTQNAGSARIVALAGSGDSGVRGVSALPEGCARLLDVVTVSEDFRGAAESLIGDVLTAADVERAKMLSAREDVAGKWRIVTPDGFILEREGVEVWMPGTAAASPLSRKMLLKDTEDALEALRVKIDAGRETLATGAEKSAALREASENARRTLDQARRQAAQTEGEAASAAREAAGLSARLEDVKARLAEVLARDADEAGRREELAEKLGETEALRETLTQRTSEAQSELMQSEGRSATCGRELTEKRIAAAQMEAERQLTDRQREDALKRRDELQKSMGGREEGIRGYEESIRRLTEETAELMASLEELQGRSARARERVEVERGRRSELQEALTQAEAQTQSRRTALDGARDMKSRLEVAAAEGNMRRQNVYDHLNQEYGLDENAVKLEADPEWKKDGPPPQEELEERIAKLNADITALGPVNLVAVDEFRELEERYTREKEQEADLLSAKEQLMALITDLNGKSGELFRTTFEQANKNFQMMFTKLFNGGEARLALLENAEDPLECGIDIIARPPGKRPQSVTLLSGGERTMTAVALLFAIFRIKPAPFTMLDELDAALDDANIGRFVEALKEFLDRSQFLIITHNQHTIAGSDLVYGVSQQEKGVSRIISMRLSEIGVRN